MALRTDLALSEEQKHFITAMFNAETKKGAQGEILGQVTMNFVATKQGGSAPGGGQGLNKIMESF